MVAIQPPDQFPLTFYRTNPADIHVSIADIQAVPLSTSRALLLSGTALSRGLVREATLYAAEQARALGVTSFVDLDLRPDQWAHPLAYGVMMRALLPLVDVVIGTEEEIFAALDSEPGSVMDGGRVTAVQKQKLISHIQQLLSHQTGPQAVVLKEGAKGATVYIRDAPPIHAAGYPVEVLNTVGAGDAFASGFIYGRLHNWNWHKSARMGNACGALVVTRHGCAAAMPSEQEVLRFAGFIKEKNGD
jgi:5-dehydro-2-deoxygluconokinase